MAVSSGFYDILHKSIDSRMDCQFYVKTKTYKKQRRDDRSMALFNFKDRTLKKAEKITERIVGLKPLFSSMSDSELRAKKTEFQERYEKGETLDELLPEVFAMVHEAGVRVLGQEAYPTQLTCGIILHGGDIAEMKTGEGKTLAAAFPACLNALTGKGVHIVTVNDYLAKCVSPPSSFYIRFSKLGKIASPV